MEKLNVAIADDNERIVELLDRIVSSDEELNVVGKAGNGEELYDIIKAKEPDVVLLDIIMPKVDGLTVMERVNERQKYEETPCLYRDHCCGAGEDHGGCLCPGCKLLYSETF